MTDKTAHVEFNGHIDQVHVGDIYHSGGRELTKDERNALNAKVRQLEREYGVPGWQPWKFLHHAIGIDKIDDMKLGQWRAADAILDCLLEKAALQLKVNESAGALTDLTRRNAEQTHELQLLKSAVQQDSQSASIVAELTRRNAEQANELQRHKQAKQEHTKLLSELATLTRQNEHANSELQTAYALIVDLKKKQRESCSTQHAQRHRWLWGAGISLTLVILFACAMAYQWHQARGLQEQLASAWQIDQHLCHIGAQPYSLGSIVTQEGRGLVQCELPGDGIAALWVRIDPPKTKAKRMTPHRKDTPATHALTDTSEATPSLDHNTLTDQPRT